MPFVGTTSSLGKYELLAGTSGGDTLSGRGLQAVFTGKGNDSLTSYSTYQSGYKTIPFLVGGAGDDYYNISIGSYAFIADLGGGTDTVNAPFVKLSNIEFAIVDGFDLLATDGSTGVIIRDPLGSTGKQNDIEKFNLYEGTYSASELYNIALESDNFIGYTTYYALDRSRYLNFSMADLNPSKISEYEDTLMKNNSAVSDSSTQTYDFINTYARKLVDDVLTGSTQFSHNSFDSKFYNLGEGRYGVQKKGESTIDEITGVTSLQFQDQALSLAEDVAATFNQVKGMDDVSGVVFRLYNAAFARLPDAKGLENWIAGNSTGGMTYATSAQEFSSSQEFKNRYGATTTDTQYITTLYNNVLGRSPDAAGLANYQRLLANGKDRGALLLDFSESPENRVLFTDVTGLS